MNTKNSHRHRLERKKLKRAARKKAAPKAKRAAGVARGSLKKKIRSRCRASASAKPARSSAAGSVPCSFLRTQEHRRADRRLRGAGQAAAQDAGSVEPDGVRHRRRDRLRHLHPHRHGGGGRDAAAQIRSCTRRCSICCCTARNAVSHDRAAGRGPGDLAVVSADGDRLRFRGAVLRGTGLHDPDRRQRLHLRLRDAGRDLSPGSSAGT